MFSLESIATYPGSENESKYFWIKRGFFFFGFKHICLNHQKRRQLLATLVAESRNHFLLLQVNKQKMLVYACLDSNTEPSPRGHGCALVGRSNADKHSWASSMHGVDSQAHSRVGKYWAEYLFLEKDHVGLWLIQQWTRNMAPQYFKWQQRLLGLPGCLCFNKYILYQRN